MGIFGRAVAQVRNAFRGQNRKVIKDRKLHYKTFIEHREEGREYLKVLPWFNQFTPGSYPAVDRFLNRPTPNLDVVEPDISYETPGNENYLKKRFLLGNDDKWKQNDVDYIEK